MRGDKHVQLVVLFVAFLLGFSRVACAQSVGSAGAIHGVVCDPTGAVVPGASVGIHNPVSGYRQSLQTDAAGEFRFLNVPQNPYHLSVSKDGFRSSEQDVNVRSSVPIELKIVLRLKGASETVTVEGGSSDLMEHEPTAHTDIDSSLASKLPIDSMSSSLSSVITLATPGVAADSNGLFHPLGDHAQTSFSVDNQPITDQQSRVFSNQLSLDSIQSMEVITGIPPAEFGDKNSLVIRAVTRSGLGTLKPYGSLAFQYGSFGSESANLTLGLGGKKFGNFLAANGLNTGRFLDPPEFQVLHAKGNIENVFDRVDYQPSTADTFHVNLSYAHAWFQQPNDFDQQAAGQDQRQLTRSFNIAPGYTHLFSPTTLLTVNGYVRQDRVGYFPTANPFANLPATLAQQRRLTNAGVKVDLSYVKGRHNAKVGVQFSHTFLTEDFRLGVTDPALNPVCFKDSQLIDPVIDRPDLRNLNQCAGAGFFPNTIANGFLPGLVPFDLTRGGSLFSFRGHTDIKQEALYAQDTLTLGQFSFLLGLRFDNYNGLSSGTGVQPRLGAAYSIKKTNTVLRLGYGRTFETPFNENLVLSSATGTGGLATNVFGAQAATPLRPGRRNHFTSGIQQAFGRHIVADAEYFWKYTRNAFDFDVLFSTPLAFPIEWKKSKIDGVGARINFTNLGGFTAYTVLGHTRARYFGPEIGGVIFNSPTATNVFRIDHDQAFQETVHAQYQFMKKGPWFGLTWRYDSGLVAGKVPDFATALTLTGDQQAQIGLFCGNVRATPTSPITSCPAGTPHGATRVRIPAEGTGNDDTNPPRIAPRHLFDVGAGIDNVLPHSDRYKVFLRFNVINVTNKVALYNFLSTFSGTHFVSPRTYQAELGFGF